MTAPNAEQRAAIKSAAQASADPAMQTAIATRNDTEIARLLNVLTASNAWKEAITSTELFQAMDITLFDGLSAGKREAWRLMLDFAPLDFRLNENRKAVVDVWTSTMAQTLLPLCLRKMTLAETYVTPDIPANRATTATIVGVKATWNGQITTDDVGRMFNPSAAAAGV